MEGCAAGAGFWQAAVAGQVGQREGCSTGGEVMWGMLHGHGQPQWE